MQNKDIVIQSESLPVRLEQLAEESAELAQAALKYARKIRGESPTPKTVDECVRALREEAADVEACLECITDVLDTMHVNYRKAAKVERWAMRIRKQGE